MTTYRDQWIICPHCGARHVEAVMSSTNYSGWTIWSDGFEAGVFHRRRTALRMCVEGHPFLIDKAEHLNPVREAPAQAEAPPKLSAPPPRGLMARLFKRPERPALPIPPAPPAPERHVLPATIVPTLDQMFAIAAGVDDPDMVLQARLFAWWAGNEEERRWGTPTVFTDQGAANAKALLTLLLRSGELHTLSKAQIMRQFGWHTEARNTYDADPDIPDGPREVLITLCRDRSPSVVALT